MKTILIKLGKIIKTLLLIMCLAPLVAIITSVEFIFLLWEDLKKELNGK